MRLSLLGNGWGVAAELRRLLTPGFLLTAAAALAMETAATLAATAQAAIRSTGHADILGTGTAAGAVQVAAMQAASLPGLLVAVAAAVGLVSADYESGTFGILLVFEPRRRVLMARKLLAGLIALAAFTLVGALAVRLCGALAQWHYGTRFSGNAPGWAACTQVAGRSEVVQIVFLATAFAAAALVRNPLAAIAAALGPVVALSPVTRTSLAPAVPHYWVSGWMHFTRPDQFQTYLWNSSSSAASTGLCLAALLTLLAASLAATAWAVHGERLLRPAD